MKKKGKALLLVSGSVLLVAGSVLGTLAYLSDTEQAVNTFTVGNVAISLAETDIDGDGNVLENKYKIVPGGEYTKDPTLTVEEGSEEAYVRMILTVHNANAVKTIIADNNLTDFQSAFLGGMDDAKWIPCGSTENTDNTISYEYRYFEIVDGTDGELEPLFDTLIIPSSLDGDELQSLVDGGFKIVVDGHAIQATGFENNEDGAWDAFDAQYAE
ncbi:MAG: hypothetical protein E7497_04980 [Ruminococcus sp.]|nr:hypothetical protein [Ruminococcus sp.]